jgi:hypothetical protein
MTVKVALKPNKISSGLSPLFIDMRHHYLAHLAVLISSGCGSIGCVLLHTFVGAGGTKAAT